MPRLNKILAEQIVSLRNDGYSYDQISTALGLTRSAVAGYLYRSRLLHLPANDIMPPESEKPPSTVIKSVPVDLNRRKPNMCCWPLWDRGDVIAKLFCGGDVPAGSRYPYCAGHMRIRHRRDQTGT